MSPARGDKPRARGDRGAKKGDAPAKTSQAGPAAPGTAVTSPPRAGAEAGPEAAAKVASAAPPEASLTPQQRLELLCPPPRLAALSGEAARRYRAAIGHVLGTGLKADTLHVDRRGYSPEAAQELGKGYLDGGGVPRVVIVSEDQAGSGLIEPPTSYIDDLLTEAYASRAVAQLTLRHTLLGTIRADRPEGGFPFVRAILELDTPDGELEELAGLRKSLEHLAAEPDHLLDAQLVRDLVTKARALAGSLGELGAFTPSGPVSICRPIGASWDVSNPGVTVLGPGHWLIVYNPSFETKSLQVSPDARLIGTDDAQLAARLVEAGYVVRDERVLPERMALLEESALVRAGLDPRPLDAQRRHTEAMIRRDGLPAFYHELHEASLAVGGRRAALMATLSPAAQMLCLVPVRDHAVVGRLLAQCDQTDPALVCRYLPERFAQIVRAAGPLEAQWALDRAEACAARAPAGSDLLGQVPTADGAPDDDDDDDGHGEDGEGIRFL